MSYHKTQKICRLTPPTFSKYAQWLPKWMSCSLKNQVNLRSSVGSWDTWQGSTILSPTVTSRWPAGLVITVDSVNREHHTNSEVFLFQNSYTFSRLPSLSVVCILIHLFQLACLYFFMFPEHWEIIAKTCQTRKQILSSVKPCPRC